MALRRVVIEMRVRTTTLGSTEGWRIKRRLLRGRAEGKSGTVIERVFGHRDVVLIEHDDGSRAAYALDELDAA